MNTDCLTDMSVDDGFPGKAFFDAVYEDPAPWDIGAPQPDLMHLIDTFPPTDPLLDVGCGTGDLAIGLARRGWSVIGVDFADLAIETARARSSALSPEEHARVTFHVGDALRPSAWSGRIGAVIDSGFYHLFDDATRRAFVGELARSLPPGGRYYMLGFAVSLPAPDVPREVTAEEVRALFSEEQGWTVRALHTARFATAGFDDVPALALCAENNTR